MAFPPKLDTVVARTLGGLPNGLDIVGRVDLLPAVKEIGAKE